MISANQVLQLNTCIARKCPSQRGALSHDPVTSK